MILKDTACSYDMLVIISMMTKLIKDTAAAGPPLMSFVTRLFRNIFLFLCVKIMMVMMMWIGDSNDGNQWLITSSKNIIFMKIGYHRNDSNQHLPHLIVIGVSIILSKFCAPWKVIPSLFLTQCRDITTFTKVILTQCCTTFSESHHILQNTWDLCRNQMYLSKLQNVFVQVIKVFLAPDFRNHIIFCKTLKPNTGKGIFGVPIFVKNAFVKQIFHSNRWTDVEKSRYD